MKFPVRTSLLDLLAGAIAFACFFAGLKWLPDNHASIMFLWADTIYLLLAIARGVDESRNLFWRVLLILIPGVCAILLLAYTGYAFTSHIYLFCFFGAAVLGTLAALLLRRALCKRSYALGWLVALALVAISFLSARVVIPNAVAGTFSKNADVVAPAFTLSALSGETVNSDQLRGHVVLLAFWATWCRPCIGELPQVQLVYHRYKADRRVVIWAVDSGISNDTVEEEQKMISAQHWDLPFAKDSENLEFKMGYHGLPKLILLDQKGRVRWVHDGFDGSENLSDEISKRVEQLLRSG
jgi:peroxiredoxin